MFRIIFFALVFATSSSYAGSRDYLYIVGSSTVSPFMAAISEEFSRSQNLQNIPTRTPIVEATGSGNGFKIFCGGVGKHYPDIVDSSRPIKNEEKEICARNGVKDIGEIKIGYDGIVFGNSSSSKKIRLTKEQIFLALAEKIYDPKSKKLVKNFYRSWNQIDPKLPKTKIIIFAPPLTSGTRDVFTDIMLEEVCFKKKEFIENYPEIAERKKQCHRFRDDEAFIESGENDETVISNLKNNPEAFAIFGFNFLLRNQDALQAAAIDGVLPDHKTISSKKYPLSRPLFVYFKKEHQSIAPQMREFIREILDEETIGMNGYLINSGLVPNDDHELQTIRKNILDQLQ